MKKTKFLSLLALPLLVGGLSSCGPNAKYKVGVCQLVKHAALDAATNGFKDTLEAEFGKDVYVDVQNAAGDSATCTTIANNFVSRNYSLIMANATPALQAVSNATTTIPVLGTSVTDYGSALSIPDFSGVTGYNVSGTSDLVAIDEQVSLFKTVFPSATKVGLLYCSAEANSIYQIQEAERLFAANGVTATRHSFTDSNDIAGVVDSAIATGIDAFYIPTDNAAANNAEIIDAKCRNGTRKVPVFAAEEGLCKTCGAFTLSIDYYKLGQKTGQMAIEILKGEKDIKTMPVVHFASEDYSRKYNETICNDLGLNIPEGFTKID